MPVSETATSLFVFEGFHGELVFLRQAPIPRFAGPCRLTWSEHSKAKSTYHPIANAAARFANQSHQFVERFPAFHQPSTNQACKLKQAHDNEAVSRYVEHVKNKINTLPKTIMYL
jgi:hypothetical protein